ncbi:MAG: EVE domain-containing protein [Myxococcota bacterium]|nr:EVE domain-containing protein [Myxococcota bacterium]
MSKTKYWLFKSEPNVFSFDDLLSSPRKTTCWDGVRNYQARNIMRDEVKIGDVVLFYHSRVEPMCIAGTAEVTKEAYADPTQFDSNSKYFDDKATRDKPRWVAVDITAHQKFEKPLTREQLKSMPQLADMVLLKKGSRLSIQPVTEAEYRLILAEAK